MKVQFAARRGASVTGYGLIVGLISVIALGTIASVGDSTNALFGTVGGEMEAVVSDTAATAAPTPTAEVDTGPPVWQTAADLGSTAFGSGVNITLSATDSDGPVTYSSLDLPSWLALNGSTGALTGTPFAEGEMGAATFTVTASQGGANVDRQFTVTAVYPSSCNAIDTAQTQSEGYQLRTINPSGSDPFLAQCYFAGSSWGGGGWTAVVVQYEQDPIGWTEGRQADYDPDTQDGNNVSFALANADIPAHSDMMFGRAQAGNNLVVDVVPFTYSTGNLGVTRVTSAETSDQYDVHRNTGVYYSHHNPEPGEATGANAVWLDTLSIDRTGGRTYSWAFSPNRDLVYQRGYGMNGIRFNDHDSYGWIILVR